MYLNNSPNKETPSSVSAPGEDVSCSVCSSFDEISDMQQEWDTFVLANGADIFMTYDWCRIWWEYYGKKRELRIFVFRCDGDLVGIVPLFSEVIWLGLTFIRAIRLVGSDSVLSQFCLPVCCEYLAEVITTLKDMLSEKRWDIIHIGRLAGMYEYYDELRDALCESFGSTYRIVESMNCNQTYFTLQSSWEQQVASLSKNQRKKIRRSYRMVQNERGELLSKFASKEDFLEVFDSFVDTHQTHWQKISRGGHFTDWPKSYHFHRDVAASQLMHNRLRLQEMKLGDFPLGYKYAYKFGHTLFSFLGARTQLETFAHLDLGRILFGEQVKAVLKGKEVKYIDSMQGEYDYKLQQGGKLFPIRSIYVCKKGIWAQGRIRIFRFLTEALDLFYYKLWFCRLAPKLPLRRQPLWKLWIRTRL